MVLELCSKGSLHDHIRKFGKKMKDADRALLMSQVRAFGCLFGYLFGSILSVTVADLWTIFILGGAVIITVALFFKELLFLSFDEEMATIHGIPVNFCVEALMNRRKLLGAGLASAVMPLSM